MALTAILVTAGCSDGGVKEDPADGSARQSGSDGASQPPEGMQWVANDLGFRFAVPESWTVIDASSIDDPSNTAAIEAFAAANGSALGVVRLRLRAGDQLLVDPKGQSTIYVRGDKGGTVPSEAQVERMWSRTSSDVEVDTVLTTLGDATRARFIGRLDGKSVYGWTLHVGVEGGVGILLISTKDYDQIAHLDRWVLPSLSELGESH